jgi:hypothetical protein
MDAALAITLALTFAFATRSDSDRVDAVQVLRAGAAWGARCRTQRLTRRRRRGPFHYHFPLQALHHQLSNEQDKAQFAMAEGVGFEPTIRFPVYTLSRRAPSTARPPLRQAARGGKATDTNPDLPDAEPPVAHAPGGAKSPK